MFANRVADYERVAIMFHAAQDAALHLKRAHGFRRRPLHSWSKDQRRLSMRADMESTDMSPE